eukprot:g721.t1
MEAIQCLQQAINAAADGENDTPRPHLASLIAEAKAEVQRLRRVLTAGDQLRAVREVSIPRVDWAAAIVSLYRRHFGTELTAESVAEDIFAEQRRQHSGSAGGAAGQGRVRRVAVPQRSQLSAADATCWFRKRNLAFYVLDCHFRVRAFNDPRQDGQSLNDEIYPRCVYALQHPFGHFGAGLPVPRHVPDEGDSDSDNHSEAAVKITRTTERARRRVEVYLLEGEDRWRAVVEPQLKRLRLELEAERQFQARELRSMCDVEREQREMAEELASYYRRRAPVDAASAAAAAIHAATDAARAIIVIDRSIAEALAARAAAKAQRRRDRLASRQRAVQNRRMEERRYALYLRWLFDHVLGRPQFPKASASPIADDTSHLTSDSDSGLEDEVVDRREEVQCILLRTSYGIFYDGKFGNHSGAAANVDVQPNSSDDDSDNEGGETVTTGNVVNLVASLTGGGRCVWRSGFAHFPERVKNFQLGATTLDVEHVAADEVGVEGVGTSRKKVKPGKKTCVVCSSPREWVPRLFVPEAKSVQAVTTSFRPASRQGSVTSAPPLQEVLQLDGELYRRDVWYNPGLPSESVQTGADALDVAEAGTDTKSTVAASIMNDIKLGAQDVGWPDGKRPKIKGRRASMAPAPLNFDLSLQFRIRHEPNDGWQKQELASGVYSVRNLVASLADVLDAGERFAPLQHGAEISSTASYWRGGLLLPLTVVPSLEAMALSKQPKCERVFLRIHDIAVVHVADHGGVGTVRRAWSTGERATGLFWHEWLARQRAMPQEPEPSVEDLLYSGKVPSHVQKDSDSDSGQTMCPAVDPTQGEQHQDAETLSEPSLVRPPITMAVPTSKPESPPPHGNVQLNKQGFCVRHPWIQVRRKKGYIFKQWEVLYDQCPLCRADAMQLVDDSATAQQDASKSYEIEVAGISEDVSDVSAKDNTFGEGLDDLLTVADAGDEDEFNRKRDTSCQPHGLKDIKVSQNELAQSSLEKHNNERVKALKDRVNKMVEKALSPAD